MCDILDLNRDDCDEAIRIFKAFLDRSGLCSSDDAINLAVSSLAMAQQASGRQTSIKELADASGVSVKDIETVGFCVCAYCVFCTCV
jgi:hypothetical protein